MGKTKDERIRVALGRAWSDHLSTVQQHLPGALAGRDSETLHQLRVALRKTRALLTLFRATLPQAAPFKDEFKWLAGATGEVRDLDVLSARARRHATAPATAAHAKPVMARLQQERIAAQQQLRTILRSQRARDLLENWRQFLATLPTRTDLPPAADVATWTSLKPLLIKHSRRLLQEGIAMDSATDPHRLHELRIRGKRLRYLLESFDELVEKHGVDRLARKLRKLQTVLGEHQDAAVAATRWRTLAQTLAEQGSMTPGTQALLEEWTTAASVQQRESRAALAEALTKFAKACKCL
jgi:CHAD domain-containing protein